MDFGLKRSKMALILLGGLTFLLQSDMALGQSYNTGSSYGNGGSSSYGYGSNSYGYGSSSPYYGSSSPYYGSSSPYYGSSSPYYGSSSSPYYGSSSSPYYGSSSSPYYGSSSSPYYGSSSYGYGSSSSPYYGSSSYGYGSSSSPYYGSSSSPYYGSSSSPYYGSSSSPYYGSSSSPYYGSSSPYYGSSSSPYYGSSSPYYGSSSPYYGSSSSPYYGSSSSPYYGSSSYGYGSSSPYGYGSSSYGYGSSSPYYGSSSPYYGSSSPYYGSSSPYYGSSTYLYDSSSYNYGSSSTWYTTSSYNYGSSSTLYTTSSYNYGSSSTWYTTSSYNYGSSSTWYTTSSYNYGSSSYGYGSSSYGYSSGYSSGYESSSAISPTPTTPSSTPETLPGSIDLTDDNAIICANNSTCTSVYSGLHCDEARSICMKDTVETCFADVDCRYSLLKCLLDPNNPGQSICTPVIEPCTAGSCIEQPLTYCEMTHDVDGLTAAAPGICLPQGSCALDTDCTGTSALPNTVCSERTCICAAGYDVYDGACNLETTDSVMKCERDETCTVIFSELHCDTTLKQCVIRDPGSCTIDAECSDTLLKCVGGSCTPIAVGCHEDLNCTSFPLTYCHTQGHGLSLYNGVCVPHYCTTDTDCHIYDADADCSDHVCGCKDGYFDDSGFCLPVLDSACMNDYDCPLNFAYCDETSFCACLPPLVNEDHICGGALLTDAAIVGSALYWNADGEPVTQLIAYFDTLPGITYDVRWLSGSTELKKETFVGGTTTTTTAASPSTHEPSGVYLLDNEIPSGTFILNNPMITLEVTPYDTSGVAATPVVSPLFPLLAVDATSVSLSIGDAVEVGFTMNFPYGCLDGETCSLDILFYDESDTNNCTGPSLALWGNNTCGCKTAPKTKADVIAAGGQLLYTPEHYSCYLTTTNDDFYETFTAQRTLKMRSYFAGTNGRAPEIEGQLGFDLGVSLSRPYTGQKACVVIPSGIIMTFDGSFIDASESTSRTVTLYRNTNKGDKMEVQLKLEDSETISGKKRVIGILVRAGDDVFVIIQSATSRSVGFISEDSTAPLLDAYKMSDIAYVIRLPTGTEVVVFTDTEYGGSVAVVIMASPADYGNTEGICGLFDGDKTGETGVLDQWQTTDDYEDATYISNNPKTWDPNDKKCVCHTSHTEVDLVCDARNDYVCKTNFVPYEGASYDNTVAARKRREVLDRKSYVAKVEHSSFGKAVDRIAERSVQAIASSRHHKRRSKRDAATHCSMATNCPWMGKVVSIIPEAEKNSIEGYCQGNYNDNNTVEWNRLYCIVPQLLSLMMLDRDPDFNTNNPTLDDDTCLGGCLNGGSCVAGECSCPTGVAGPTCSLNTTEKPTVITEPEQTFTIQTVVRCLNITSTNGFAAAAICRIQQYSPVLKGIGIEFELSQTNDVVGVHITFYLLQCCVPSRRRRRSTSSTNSQMSVQTSNDGQTFSDPVVVTTVDSTCQNITNFANGSTYIEVISGYCFIDGVCVTEDTVNPASDCQFCTPSVSVFNWNDTCVYSTDDDDEGLPGYAIALIVLAVLGVAVAVGAVLFVVFLKEKLIHRISDVFRREMVREPSNAKFMLRKDAEVAEAWK